MRTFLLSVITIAILVASGSVAYYYVVFLPQQNLKSQEDLSAIRSVVAPTPEQQKVQQEQELQSWKATENAVNSYTQCLIDMQEKGATWLDQKCPSANDPFDSTNCRLTVMSSAEYQSKFGCKYPF